MQIVLKLISGEFTNKPYRIVTEQFGVGVECQTKVGRWEDMDQYFESIEEAMLFIQEDDMNSHFRHDELFSNEL